MMKNNTLKLTYTAVMTAVICVVTMLVKIPLPYGYANISDAVILLFCAVVGHYALIAASLGTMLADIFSGYAMYAPYTFVIKMLVALIGVYACKQRSALMRTFLFAVAQCAMVVGYFFTDWLFYGMQGAIGTLFGNSMQGVVCVVIATLLYRPIVHATKWLKIDN